MNTTLVPVIAEKVRAAEGQIQEMERLVEPLSQDQLDWRPNSARWSVGEHLHHLIITNQPYLTRIKRTIEDARTRRLESSGPYKSTWIGSRFAQSLEPPPKRRMRTFRSLQPSPRIAKADLVSKFQATMNDVIEAMKMANGLDLGLASMRSPFFFLLRMNLVEAFQVILAHNRRHFWLAREVMARADYPSQ
jgi:hypothetical protein